ncbi:hypothetical protein LCGC14_2064130 [marine sediment metagenome]|uniref:DNA binding HTH domain-containing protein n=1 Tax=marine sediment metagenome TaxID=412755 RepID=A0A0F9HHB1_9ZZZZ
MTLETIKKKAVSEALMQTNGNISKAAIELDISRQSIYNFAHDYDWIDLDGRLVQNLVADGQQYQESWNIPKIQYIVNKKMKTTKRIRRIKAGKAPVQLCIKHEENIRPKYIKQNMDTGCSKCIKEWTIQRRTREYNDSEILCRNYGIKRHPKNRNKPRKSDYIKSGLKICNWCMGHNLDGSKKPSHIRRQRRKRLRRSIKLSDLRIKEQMQHNTIPNDWSVEYYG